MSSMDEEGPMEEEEPYEKRLFQETILALARLNNGKWLDGTEEMPFEVLYSELLDDIVEAIREAVNKTVTLRKDFMARNPNDTAITELIAMFEVQQLIARNEFYKMEAGLVHFLLMEPKEN
jgi:hypothetical protein